MLAWSVWLLHTHKELGAEQEASQEAIAAIWAKNDSGSDQSGEMRWGPGHILKADPMGFAVGLDVGSEKGSNQEGIQGFRPQ